MTQTGNRMQQQKSEATLAKVALNLEVHIIPVSDVDRSKKFYQLAGWRLDEDVSPAKGIRIVQFTPPGSGCSVNFGTGIAPGTPGSAAAALVVSDIKAAHVPIPNATATGRFSPSRIPTEMRGWSRRSRPGVPAAADPSELSPSAPLLTKVAEQARGPRSARRKSVNMTQCRIATGSKDHEEQAAGRGSGPGRFPDTDRTGTPGAHAL
jgi:predicted enzyme related to lactoylglutathione lyase